MCLFPTIESLQAGFEGFFLQQWQFSWNILVPYLPRFLTQFEVVSMLWPGAPSPHYYIPPQHSRTRTMHSEDVLTSAIKSESALVQTIKFRRPWTQKDKTWAYSYAGVDGKYDELTI